MKTLAERVSFPGAIQEKLLEVDLHSIEGGLIISSGTQNDKTRTQPFEELQRLEQELRERQAALPAHSVRPHQLMEIEELEDRITKLKNEIRTGRINAEK